MSEPDEYITRTYPDTEKRFLRHQIGVNIPVAIPVFPWRVMVYHLLAFGKDEESAKKMLAKRKK